MLVVKRFEFDAAHRLYPYEGKCSNIHGHRYVVEAGFVSRDGVNEAGMVVDFGELKACIGSFIDKQCDHRLFLSFMDPDLDQYKKLTSVNVLSSSPTAEAMATYFQGVFRKLILNTPSLHHLSVALVRVWETPTSYAELRS